MKSARNIAWLTVCLLLGTSCGVFKSSGEMSLDGKPAALPLPDMADGYGSIETPDFGSSAADAAQNDLSREDATSTTGDGGHKDLPDSLETTDAVDALEPGDTVLKETSPECGNGACEPGETWVNCFEDCPGACGNGDCEPGEDAENCPWDCADPCGDCICQASEGAETCPVDCGYCGDGICSLCDDLNEDAEKCPEDCAIPCGNCICEGGENPQNCPKDCGWCGDGFCSPCGPMEETPQSCPPDCT